MASHTTEELGLPTGGRAITTPFLAKRGIPARIWLKIAKQNSDIMENKSGWDYNK